MGSAGVSFAGKSRPKDRRSGVRDLGETSAARVELPGARVTVWRALRDVLRALIGSTSSAPATLLQPYRGVELGPCNLCGRDDCHWSARS
jgi:hypothetical protein